MTKSPNAIAGWLTGIDLIALVQDWLYHRFRVRTVSNPGAILGLGVVLTREDAGEHLLMFDGVIGVAGRRWIDEGVGGLSSALRSMER
ncbi:hypothetical protein GCM10023319_46490 [Nocardia iowensis]